MNTDTPTVRSAVSDPSATVSRWPTRLLSLCLLSMISLTGVGGCEIVYAYICALQGGYIEFTQSLEAGALVCTLNGGGESSTSTHRVTTTAIASGEVFWTEAGARVFGTTGGGIGSRKVADFGRFPVGVAVAPSLGQIFWSDLKTNTIRRANLDGTGEAVLLSGLSESVVDDAGRFASLTDVAVDASGGKLYWGNVSEGAIQRANLDGSGLETIVTGLSGPAGIDLDLSNGTIYWTDLSDVASDRAIQRANLDGTGVEEVLSGLSLPQDVAVDPAAGHVYWTAPDDGAIRRANLDGSSVTDVLTGLNAPGGLALDASGGKLYWGSIGDIAIRRANLDGTALELIAAFTPAAALAVDPSGGTLYWAGWVDGTVRRADLDGSNPTSLSFGRNFAGRIALDEGREAVYWPAPEGVIQRANVDGTGVTDLTPADPFIAAQDVAYDPVSDKIYWTVIGNGGEVRRADVDGANPETLASGLGASLADIVVNGSEGKVYWLNENDASGNRSIQRANVDGTGVETFYTPGGNDVIRSLAIDGPNLYWVLNFDVVQRVDLSTLSGIEDIITRPSEVLQAVTVGDGKVYWSFSAGAEGTVRRSDLDGTNVEDVITGIPASSIGDLAFFGAGVIPVELASLRSQVDGRDVVLQWQTLSETDNAGFDVQMQSAQDEARGDWQRVAFVDGAGTTTAVQDYRFRVRDLAPGPYRFRLRQIDVDGTATLSSVVTATVAPGRFVTLTDPAPHPVQTATSLTLTLREAQHVRAVLYDLLGRPVATLHEGVLPAGTDHRLRVDGRDLASGVYFVRVEGETFRETRRLVRVR